MLEHYFTGSCWPSSEGREGSLEASEGLSAASQEICKTESYESVRAASEDGELALFDLYRHPEPLRTTDGHKSMWLEATGPSGGRFLSPISVQQRSATMMVEVERLKYACKTGQQPCSAKSACQQHGEGRFRSVLRAHGSWEVPLSLK
jgi:hypothetical protein